MLDDFLKDHSDHVDRNVQTVNSLGHSGQSIALGQTLDSQTRRKAHKQKREKVQKNKTVPVIGFVISATTGKLNSSHLRLLIMGCPV